jgi:hypothetical protein
MLHRFIYDISTLQDRLIDTTLGEPQAVITATESEKKVDQDESAEDQNKL